jgi:hypothetical protein
MDIILDKTYFLLIGIFNFIYDYDDYEGPIFKNILSCIFIIIIEIKHIKIYYLFIFKKNNFNIFKIHFNFYDSIKN